MKARTNGSLVAFRIRRSVAHRRAVGLMDVLVVDEVEVDELVDDVELDVGADVDVDEPPGSVQPLVVSWPRRNSRTSGLFVEL
jgi:hypothetical protein